MSPELAQQLSIVASWSAHGARGFPGSNNLLAPKISRK